MKDLHTCGITIAKFRTPIDKPERSKHQHKQSTTMTQTLTEDHFMSNII